MCHYVYEHVTYFNTDTMFVERHIIASTYEKRIYSLILRIMCVVLIN